MTERAYQTAKRLATDPSTTEAERESARQRCAEYERDNPPVPPRSRRPNINIEIDADMLWSIFGTDYDNSSEPPSLWPRPRPSIITHPTLDQVRRYGKPPEREPSRIQVASAQQVDDLAQGRRPR